MVVSFAQLVAATPFVLVVRRSNNLRSFLGGLNMVNVSGPKVCKSLLPYLRSDTNIRGWGCKLSEVNGNQMNSDIFALSRKFCVVASEKNCVGAF